MADSLPHLTDDGKCPECDIMPLDYEQLGYKHCYRCLRNYDHESGQMIPNWWWREDNTPTPKHIAAMGKLKFR